MQIAFNITPPNSVVTLFETWLVGIESKTARDIRVGVCALLWAIWNCRNDLAFKNNNYSFFAGFIPSYCADPYVVVTHSDGGQGAFGYWIYPLGDGSSGYLQPVWLAVI